MNQEQFARALYQGLGRAILYAQNNSVDAYAETIITACLYNPVYDPLIDTDRAPYLAELIALTGAEALYRRAILEALGDPEEEMDERQLCDFAVIFARDGDAAARRALYARFADNASCGDTTGYRQIIALDGAEGVLHVVRTFGAALRRAVRFDDEWFPDHLLDDLQPLLDDAADADPDLAAFRQHVEAASARHAATEARQAQYRAWLGRLPTIPYAEVLQQSVAGHLSPGRRSRWGAAAPEAELLLAARDLLAATDSAEQLLLLPFFTTRPFPLDHRGLLPLLNSPHERVASFAATALGLIAHPAIRALALALVAAPGRRDHGLRLLAGNLVPADYVVLEALVIAETDDDALHNLTDCVRTSFERLPAPEAAGVLEQLYERGPCGLCRQDIVAALLALGPLPAFLAAECRYDADPALRELVR